jgi:hypothetical protein
MLVTFSSKAGADILMLAQHAKPLLTIIGKTDDKDLLTRGVFMPDQLEAAIFSLEHAIAAEPNQHQDNDEDEDSDELVDMEHMMEQRKRLCKSAPSSGVKVVFEGNAVGNG